MPTNTPKKKFEMKRSSPSNDCLGATCKRTRSSKATTKTRNTLMKLMMKLEAQTPVLQRFWNNTRVNSTGRLVKRFLAVGSTSTRVKRMQFDEVVSKNRIAATKACLQHIHLLTTFRHGSPAPRVRVPEKVNVPVFLTGFMIAYHPTTRVFETMGALEQALFDSTVPL